MLTHWGQDKMTKNVQMTFSISKLLYIDSNFISKGPADLIQLLGPSLTIISEAIAEYSLEFLVICYLVDDLLEGLGGVEEVLGENMEETCLDEDQTEPAGLELEQDHTQQGAPHLLETGTGVVDDLEVNKVRLTSIQATVKPLV